MSKYNWNIYNNERLINDLVDEFDELAFVEDVIKTKRRKGSKLPKKRFPLAHLVYLCRKIYSGYYTHKTFLEKQSISYKVLELWFGEDYHRYTDILLDYTETWSKKDSLTRGWSLKDRTRKVLDKYFEREVRRTDTNRLLGLDGKVIKKLPGAAIMRTVDNEGRRMRQNEKMESNIHSVVELNFNNIQSTIDMIRQIKDVGYIKGKNNNAWTRDLMNYSPDELTNFRKSLLELRDITDSEMLPKGKMYQHYYEGQTGRVYSTGQHSLQRMKKIIRDIVLGGVGYWDYDIQNCHYTIMNQLGNDYGLRTFNSFDNYIKNKSKIRKSLSKELKVDVSIIKECIIAILYGCKKSVGDKNKLTELLGRDKHLKLLQNDWITELFDDREDITNSIIDKTIREPKKYRWLKLKGIKKQYFENCRNKRLNYLDENGKKTQNRFVLAHILQGIESKMLDICMGVELGRVGVLIHDGFVTRGTIDEVKYSTAIENELGISVKFDKKKLDCELDHVVF